MTRFVDQQERRQTALQTAETFSEAVSGTTTIYNGRADEFFLIRKLIVVNSTAGAISFTLSVGGVLWVPATSIAAGTSVADEAIEGSLVAPAEDVTVTGNGLRVLGWGVRVRGGSDWTL